MKKDEKLICETYSQKTVQRYKKNRPYAFFNEQLVNPMFREIILTQGITQKKIVDVGCGYGADMEYLIQHGASDVTGVEINQYFVDELKKNPVFKNTVKVYQQSIYDLTLPQKYDISISNMVLDQVNDLEEAFFRIGKILKKNGVYIFSMMHPMSIATRDYRDNLTEYFVKKTKIVHPRSLDKDLVIYQRTIGDISKALHNNGFVIKNLCEPQPICKKSNTQKNVYHDLPGALIICAQKSN